MSPIYFTYVFFFYGLAFFTMGVAILLEGGRGSDPRLRQALNWLAVFGLVHGAHEWVEMFQGLNMLPGQAGAFLTWEATRLGVLVVSFLALATFGAALLPCPPAIRCRWWMIPVGLAVVWAISLALLYSQLPAPADFWPAAFALTRYLLAVPGALLTSIGLVAQQRDFRRAGLVSFGRDSLWASLAFAVYGLIGQVFVQASRLPPTHLINQDLFLQVFGFPIQLLRAATAVVAAFFVIRFLRAFEVETRRQLAQLQAVRVAEAERREAWRGELLRRVVSAQEAERQRIARELHDATGQTLTGLGLGLRGVATTARQDPERAVQELRKLETMAAEALDELRQLIADLRPSHLDDLGLAATLRWYAKQVQARSGLTVHVEVHGQERPLDASAKITLFRVIQEALTNVVKHSGAHTAWIRLSYDEDQVGVEVEDDGGGFITSERDRRGRPAWGLLGMEERASLLGGRFHLQSAVGGGTCVGVTIPYREMEAQS